MTFIKFIKKMLVTISVIVAAILVLGLLFVNISPQFGGQSTQEQRVKYAESPNYEEGKFINLGKVTAEMSSQNMMKAIAGMFKRIPDAVPSSPIAVQTTSAENLATYSGETRFFWFGHSAILVQVNGRNLLIDPMLGDVPAPHPLLGGKRFSKQLPITIEDLPHIDAVLISHDHYDHLDYGSIIQLKDKVDHFYTPLGLGNHLVRWGVGKDKITELDWWQEVSLQDLVFTSTPAQHFSGRGLTDRDKTLWCSWVIASPTEKFFFSGDSGYAPHFKSIGNQLGPFDFAMIECGQYNELWPDVHMFPEETAQAGVDLRAKKIMPVHWAAFKLAQHAWTDPIERVAAKTDDLGLELVAPKIGQPFTLRDSASVNSHWWRGN